MKPPCWICGMPGSAAEHDLAKHEDYAERMRDATPEGEENRTGRRKAAALARRFKGRR